jgi:hypothetical protein
MTRKAQRGAESRFASSVNVGLGPKGDVGVHAAGEIIDIVGDRLLQACQAQFAIAEGDIRQRLCGQLIVDRGQLLMT